MNGIGFVIIVQPIGYNYQSIRKASRYRNRFFLNIKMMGDLVNDPIIPRYIQYKSGFNKNMGRKVP